MYRQISRLAAAVFCAAAFVSPVHAASNNIDIGLIPDQPTFDAFVDEVAAISAYNPLSPAEPLGIPGFEIGIAVSSYSIDTEIWDSAVIDGAAPSQVPVPRLLARVGLPFGIDVGASYAAVPDSNIKNLGGEVRWAFLEGSTATPAMALIGHASQLSGVTDFDLSTYGVDLGISKGFAMFTPYAAVGEVWYKGTQSAGLGFEDRNTSDTRYYAGVQFGLLVFNLVAQVDFAPVTAYSLRFNVGF
jgi:hypothetical protein